MVDADDPALEPDVAPPGSRAAASTATRRDTAGGSTPSR